MARKGSKTKTPVLKGGIHWFQDISTGMIRILTIHLSLWTHETVHASAALVTGCKLVSELVELPVLWHLWFLLLVSRSRNLNRSEVNLGVSSAVLRLFSLKSVCNGLATRFEATLRPLLPLRHMNYYHVQVAFFTTWVCLCANRRPSLSLAVLHWSKRSFEGSN